MDPPGAGGTWTDPVIFTASGTFTAPSSGVRLNKRGKVEVFLTGTAAGGSGGSGNLPEPPAEFVYWFPWGGEAGQWCRRFKVELNPAESVAVTIPTQTPINASGGALTFGSYLTLSGGIGGEGGRTDYPAHTLNMWGGLLISGSDKNDNVIRRGAHGGRGARRTQDAYDNSFPGIPGGTNPVMGNYLGGYYGFGSSGPGGAGLFGDGGGGNGWAISAPGGDAIANGGGGGGGGGAWGVNNGGKGAGGQLWIEWRVAA
jgi:hypothetical protein